MNKTDKDLLNLQRAKQEYDSSMEFKKSLKSKPITESEFLKIVQTSKGLSRDEKIGMLTTYSKHLRSQGMLVDDPEMTFTRFKEELAEEDPKILPVKATTIQQMTREQFRELTTVKFAVFQDTNTQNHTAYHYIGKNGKQFTAGNIDAMNVKVENKVLNYDGKGYGDVTIQAIDQATSEAQRGRLEVPKVLKHIAENRDKYHEFRKVEKPEAVGTA